MPKRKKHISSKQEHRKRQRSNSYGEVSISKQLPAFYCEPGRRSDKDKELASKKKSTKSQSRPSTPGARATSATKKSFPCSMAEIDNRCSTNEHLNVADSPQASEVTNHPSAGLSDSSVPSSAPASKTYRQSRIVASKKEQDKRRVTNSPRPRTSDANKRNKDFKAEEKTKMVTQGTGNNAMRKDIRSVDLSHSTRVGRLAVGVAS